MRAQNKGLYPDDWGLISWIIRYMRASGRCEWIDESGQRCARIDGEPIPGNAKTMLTVAHLDHNPANCDFRNLLALCQYHHLKYDAKHHAENAARTRQAKKEALYDGLLL